MTVITSLASKVPSKANMPKYQGAMPTLYNSPLGTPVYSDLSIEAGSYSMNGKTINYNVINMPNALFVVSKKKRIVVTSISGSYSDIFEYTGEESAQVSCTVKFYGSNLNYPKATMQNFYLMLESNQPIKLNSWYLNQLNIMYAMVTDYDIPQQSGNISDQQVKFNMREMDTDRFPTLLHK